MTLTELLNRVAVIAIAAVVIGLIGRRWRPIRVILVWVAPLCSAAITLYLVFEGSVSQCSGFGATLRCWEVSYASVLWSAGALAIAPIVVAVILTLAPVASAWLRRSAPSLVAVYVLPVLIGVLISVLFWWSFAWPAVLAAAIAGPPSREPSPKETVDRQAVS